MSKQNPWLAKLAAWTHDPAEKALVLMRDPLGHEGGTVRDLRKKFFPDGMPPAIKAAMKRADHWAAAADRPQFGGGGRDYWAQVRFDKFPLLIHPLSGEEYDLKSLDIDPEHIKALSGMHFDELIVDSDDENHRKTALNFWRFGPELECALPTLWQLLPADTRVPDHTIWAHLDLSSAFATAFVADETGDAALLSMSFGPVQDFIAAARTTSDLWAGSHLLSRIAWEGLKVIASEIGPDAVLFPQLRGVPQVDLWLRDEIGLPKERFAQAEWVTQKTDANPLFMAALPNKFVAIVPAGQAVALAEKVTAAVRDWVKNTAQAMLDELLEKSGTAKRADLPCHEQLAAQLAGFPEVHWATVPFSLIASDADGKALAEQETLAAASRPFFGKDKDKAHGFLGSEVWRVLAKEIDVDGARFFTPNPGVLYPAIYDLLDRVGAAAKSVRPFAQSRNEGYRCDLTGEAEWLTTDRAQLSYGKSGRQDAPTLWNAAAKAQPGLFRKGEHLSALAMLKRLWPRTFVGEIARITGNDIGRYVVSTHTMALASSLESWIARDGGKNNPQAQALLAEARTPTALPRRLIRQLAGKSAATQQLARCLPAWLDDDGDNVDSEARQRQVKALLGEKPEAYYAFIMMDGDKMGAWLSGTEADYNLPYAATWHPQIRNKAKGRFPQLDAYLKAERAVSPARHMAISAALNSFALRLARHVVEDMCKGKLIYAGGDDVLAMVSVDDLLRCLFLLRLAYSGVWPEQSADLDKLLGTLGQKKMATFRRGHALLDGQLIRLMGQKATASAGAIVAHHQASLSRVLRELRASEKRAKNEGGRDAFSINLLKRSGGAVHLTLPWLVPGEKPDEKWEQALKGSLSDTPMALLLKLRAIFAGDTSRKAAYLTQGWLTNLPAASQIGMETLQAMIASNLEFQLKRQGGKNNQEANAAAARLLVESACRIATQRGSEPAPIIRDLLAVAEFLAREGRTGEPA
jgi:CRISPR-associated protein Cmr2